MVGQRRRLGWPSLLVYLIYLLDGAFSSAWLLTNNQEFYDFAFIDNFTNHLYLRHNIECFVTFAKSRRLMKTLPGELFARSVDRTMVEDLNIPLVVWGQQSNAQLGGLLTNKTLVFVSIQDLSPDLEPMLEVVHKSLDGRHDLRILFILRDRRFLAPSREKLFEFFSWCWKRNFINVALTYQLMTFRNGSRVVNVHDELFSYTPFPKMRLLNVTRLGATYNWEAIDISNVRGYEFRVPVYQDVIQAFLLPDGQLYGVLGLLLTSYVAQTNGRLRVEATPDVNEHNYHSHTLLAAAYGNIDIGVHPYTQMTLRSEQAEGGLSMTYTKTCLMVPWQREVPLNRFARHFVRNNGWLLVALVVSFTLGWHMRARDSSKGFYFALAIFYLQPVNDGVFRRFANAYKLMHIAFLFNSFILWNARTAYLSAAFSAKVTPPQINSVEDFLSSPLRIMVSETEVAMYFTRELLPAALQSRLLVVNVSTLLEHRNSLNTSYAYCSTARHWQLVRFQQSRLRLPLFRRVKPNLCTSAFIRQIPMQRNSPFRERFMWSYIDSHRNGFYKKWEQLSFIQAVQMGLLKIYRDVDQPYASLNLKNFTVLFMTYLLSVGLCVLCLLCEIFWKYRAYLIVNRC